MTTTDLPTVKVNSPAELVSAVPYLLGFHPEESLVAIGLNDAHVVVTARINLPDVQVPGVLLTLFDAIKRATASRTVIVMFTDTAVAESATSRLLTETIEAAGIELLDVLLVASGRWRSLRYHDLACCPADGTAIPGEVAVIATAATRAGLTALPNRDALAAMFAPLPDRADLAADLSDYENHALAEVEEHRKQQLERSPRRIVPQRAREAAARDGKAAQGRVRAVRGGDMLLKRTAAAYAKAGEGIGKAMSKAGRLTLSESRVLRSFRRRGHPVADRQ